MKDSPQPTKRRRYDAAFRAEALRLVGESRSTQAAAWALPNNVQLFHKWQKEALTPVAAALDPATAAEWLQLPATNRYQAQELESLNNAIANFLSARQPLRRYRFIEAQRKQYPMRLPYQVVAVPASGYYAWQQAQEQAGREQSPAWEEVLDKIFGRHKRCSGTRRLQVALRRQGCRGGRQRLRGASTRCRLPTASQASLGWPLIS